MIQGCSRGLLIFYLGVLIWLVLFKLQYDILSVFDYHFRSLNFIPFVALSIEDGSFRQMIENVVIFVPLGLLLEVHFKNIRVSSKFAFILALSLTFELLQYIFAIGATDITDVIANTLGGILGLKMYGFCSKHMNQKILDIVIICAGMLLLAVLLYYRSQLKIKYA
ncbi:VanZ family protein [Gorillibacterium sp. sgz5001074]|uniref:VanZ family protein n=1 Tax=Gorillibacterium sp. sgz5001074 TaxID=3446695 RepID=UPI003F66C8DE